MYITKKEKVFWGGVVLCILIFLALRLIFFPWYFLTGCIFERHIRWDMGTCAGEQWEYSTKKAANIAAQFWP